MRLLLLSTLLLSACGSEEKDDTGTTDSGDTSDSGGECLTPDCGITVDEQYEGDTTCFDGTTWGLGRTVDPAKVGTEITLAITVEDFQSGDEVLGGASIDVWHDDDITHAADATYTAGEKTGEVSVDMPACQATAYKVYTPAKWEETVDTYEFHKVFGVDDTSDTWNSVSTTTSNLIPTLLGLQWEPGTAIIAGTAYDCNENGIHKAQVFIHDASGNSPSGMQVRYFANDLPNADQPYTNTDGLWSAINVPPGDYTVEMWVNDGGTFKMMGSTQMSIAPDSVNISNIFTGLQDGVYYPDSCLAG